MGVEWTLAYVVIFLQVLAGLVLVRDRSQDKLALRLFGVLFFLNAGVAAIMTLPREYAIWLASDAGIVTRAFRALDAPTGFLLLAFAAARSGLARHQRLVWWLVGAGALTALLQFPFHTTMIRYEYAVRAIPLYVGYGVAAYVCAGGRGWERWIALALVARMLYWGMAGVFSFASEGIGNEPNVTISRIGLMALMVVSVAAAARLLRREGGPRPSITILVLLVGPACAFFEMAIQSSLPPEHVFRFGSVVVLNLVTLGLVRPVVTIAGLAPDKLVPIVGRASLAAGLGALSTILVRFELPSTRPTSLDLAVDDAATFGVGLVVGLLVLAFVEWLPGLGAGSRDARTLPIVDGGAGPDALARAAGHDGAPHWQVLLRALRDSSSHGPAGKVDFRVTQKGLVAHTGLRASRISTLVRELNASSEARLDAYVPGWREAHRGRAPFLLIEQSSGAVEGRAGAWTYYRLSPAGELLAAALPPALDGQSGLSSS